MTVIIDSKVYLYKAVQSGRLTPEMFEIIIEELSYAVPQVPFSQSINSIIFVGDLGKSAYRLSLSPIYKAHRAHKAEYKEAMEQYIGLIPNLSKTLGFIPMFVPEVEADDLAGILTNILTTNTNEQVLPLTQDRDWSQLVLRFPNTYIKFANRKLLYTKEDIQREEEVSDWFEFLLKKALVSDRGDNILGLNRCGIVCYKKFLQELKDKVEGFDSLPVYQKYQAVMDNIELLDKFSPHKNYLEFNPNMSTKEAIKLNFQLGEIMTSVKHLTKQQTESVTQYLKEIKESLNSPIVVNFQGFDSFVEQNMPNEVNDFGFTYTLPEYYQVMYMKVLGV